ncbi:short-chain-enoyl-CoA hydratase [Sporomusa acidovorans]|uniref:Short-chain-enoyl-CoA hydratase n=1 Tax=Sporomusa acidovorans (strain ATCC 49682 / DSM 3132 / Mol) TaxID=1123286 RepID=A0ABZ3J8K7_SPOA4|nr:short-chain-enoyl-CoA hydratase [Sporomusa acidovorans]OZC16112.1 putative enoyl-CoA hydratase echA8 [Sporomusa acidovorans DSM 3132]SDD86425.1 enoyl-CoA hydratase [Sporomusa acidovorans]
MSEYSTLLITEAAGIAVVSLNRPEALNALNSTVLNDLSAAFDEVAGNDTVKAVILTGAGEKSFVAGADITQMKDMNVVEAKLFAEKGQSVFLKIEQFPKPVIAAINGFALGGGCELAMACDIRIASENARFGQPEVGLGIIPGFGGTQRLARLVGRGMAKFLIYTADIIDAQEALRIGLVQKVTTPEALLDEAHSIVKRILKKSSIAVSLVKDAINRGMEMDIANAMQYEAYIFGTCFASEDQKEGMAAFVEKRKPSFCGQFAK